MPVPVKSGDPVWAGSTVVDGSVVIRAEADSGSSRIDEVIRLVDKSQSQKAEIEKRLTKLQEYSFL